MKLYELKEVENKLGVTQRTLYRWIAGGELEAVKVGGRWKVDEDALKRYIDRNTVNKQ